MVIGQITWEQFIVSNNDASGIQYKFEDLCRQLFTYEFLSKNKTHKYLHSNPSNAGIESEPIWDEMNEKYIGYQAKFFDNATDYKQIKESVEMAIKHYKGKLDIIYLFCNKALTTTCPSYMKIEEVLSDAGIVLQPITDTMILDLVRKYPNLGKYYFDEHSISHEWFKNKTSATIDILGDRFNSEFNVDTEASRNLSVFLQDQYALDYYNNKKKNLIKEIRSLRWELDEFYNYAYNLSEFIMMIPDVKFNNICEVENWQGIILSEFKNDISEIEHLIEVTRADYEKNKDNNVANKLEKKLKKLEKLKSIFYGLELPEIEKQLLKNKILTVEGKAGIGKTQLFANKTKSIIDEENNALLIIGSDCLADINILEQIKNNLRLHFDFESLIDIMEVIGETSGKIVPILIDALNESWRPQLWKTALPVLHKKINDKKYVRLAVSYRSEYRQVILPERFINQNNVVKIEHKGFRNNPIEAAKTFLNYYGIAFTPLHIFMSNIDNPLFIILYCKTYQGDEAGLPLLYDRLLQKVNEKIHIKLAKVIETAGYDQSVDLVLPVVKEISMQTLLTGKRHFEKKEIEELSIWASLGLNARPFITQLIQENILHDYELNGNNYLYFAFDQMNDYFMAKAILSKYQKKEQLRKYTVENVLGIVNGEFNNWQNEDLLVHICALYAEKYEEECISIIDAISNKTEKENLFRAYVKSFAWRSKVYLSLSEFMELCSLYSMVPNELWDCFIENSLKLEHILNADNLHIVLMRYSIARRDYLWTTFINGKNSDDERLVQVIEIYNKCEKYEFSSNQEQIRLLLILFSWVLTSSNRWLRDITSKAMVEILKEHFNYAKYLLELFSDVNDPYVIQRLYGVVFGACVKRSNANKEIFKELVCFVFDNIFNKDYVYPDILLRDYARLIIERYLTEYPGELQNYDLEKIKPPYKSISIPDIIDPQYLEQKYDKGLFYIKHSMRFDGMGMYGDFGRYVFQRALEKFEVDEHQIFNYAMHYIIHELEYNCEYFDEYDRMVTQYVYDRHRTIKTERIGKKYQWIAMYNILARVSDYCPMKSDFSEKDEIVSYDGPWKPNVRDFDPTLNNNSIFCNHIPYFAKINEHIVEAINENRCAKESAGFDEIEWTKTESKFFEYQKEDLLLTDEKGVQWIALSRYADTGRDNLAYDKLMVWNWLYGYFVTDKQLAILKEYATKKVNMLDSEIAWIPETYILYNREYPWSSGSKTVLKWQWINLKIRTGEIRLVTRKYEVPQFSIMEDVLKKYSSEFDDKFDDELTNEEDFSIPMVDKIFTKEEPVTIEMGRALNTTQAILWEGEFDASKGTPISYSHPCAEIINVLKLKQEKYDGYYYDELGELIAYDSHTVEQNAGLIIRKDALDKFLKISKYYLVWFVKAAKEVHGKSQMITNVTDWTGLLEYNGDVVQGEYYIINEKEG